MIGESLKKIRNSKRMKQKELANWLGVSRQAISMWEAGKREMKVTTLHKIAKVFGVTVDEIIRIQQSLSEPKGGGTMLTKTAPKPVKTKERASFRLQAPNAKNVAVTGDFTSWDEKGIKMKKSKEGVWSVGVDLKPGRYEYKFIVDNQWTRDPANGKVVVNSFGSENSILEVAA